MTGPNNYGKPPQVPRPARLEALKALMNGPCTRNTHIDTDVAKRIVRGATIDRLHRDGLVDRDDTTMPATFTLNKAGVVYVAAVAPQLLPAARAELTAHEKLVQRRRAEEDALREAAWAPERHPLTPERKARVVRSVHGVYVGAPRSVSLGPSGPAEVG